MSVDLCPDITVVTTREEAAVTVLVADCLGQGSSIWCGRRAGADGPPAPVLAAGEGDCTVSPDTLDRSLAASAVPVAVSGDREKTWKH
ncbi:hypothetical protein MCAG_05226 [Micromonospora sp. ATCC 39149]|uniref:Uncharacterized protein n=1 Tax=Micromonospora carbonacea TaxID=47853 RepID=A0A7D6CG36_9ACTN|nr:hypothetical protein [Micromonospora sp. ATCC 39149]EEP74899.1 hypothetical protein MCAG_05226 [Micromonospora sp. ATCC 39149]QLK00656.1 hypothetical protein HZU44_12000 [Micromonospora carbonacea]